MNPAPADAPAVPLIQREDRGLVSVILATYNERENILDTIRAVFEHVPPPVEAIVVDDDSPDQTWKLVEDLHDDRVVLIRRVATRGLASAFNRGIIESRGSIVCWMDADMSMPPALLPEMINRLSDHDVSVGSRYAEGALDDRAPLRVFSSRLINGFGRWTLGGDVKDMDSGFVALRRTVFNSVSVIPTGYGAYFMEFLHACRRKHLKIVEVPFVFRDRAKGTSKSFRSLTQFFLTGMGYGVRILLARLRPLD